MRQDRNCKLGQRHHLGVFLLRLPWLSADWLVVLPCWQLCVQSRVEDRLRTATDIGRLAALAVDDPNMSESFNSSAHPAKASFFIRMRVTNPCDLFRRRKEILVNERIVVGQEDPKTGMGMIPARDRLVGILLVFALIDVFPGIVGESNVCAGLLRVQAANASLNLHAVAALAAHQNTTDFGLDAGASVPSYLANHITAHRHPRALAVFFSVPGPVTHASPIPDASEPRTCEESPYGMYPISRFEERATKRSSTGERT